VSGLRRVGWPAFATALAVAPVVFWDGGVVEEEALGFLRNFWGERGVLQRIFDPRGYDFYQGRELSYAVDFLDAQWLRWVLGRGVLLVAAPSALAAALAMVGIGLWLVPRALPRLPRAAGWLLLAVYLSNFALASTTGILYRATKPLVAPLLLGLLLLLLAERRQPRYGPRTGFALAFAPALAMSLLDRQGLFYLLALSVLLFVAWWRERRGLPFLLAALAAAACWAAYNYALGPFLIEALNGYRPEMRFQRLRPGWLAQVRPWLESARLLLDWARVLLGGVPRTVAAALAALGLIAWVFQGRRPLGRLGRAGLAAAALGLQLAMLAIMVLRHEPVTWIDHRFWYYPLPFQALLLFGLLWGCEWWTAARGRLPRAVPLVLAALVVANLARWPARRALMETGPWFADVSRRSRLMIASLRTGREQPLLDGDHRRFYFECLERFPRLAARATEPFVAEGAGVEIALVEDGQLSAWAGREAHLVVTAPKGGRYQLVGELWLRPDERVEFLLATRPPRLLGEIVRGGADAGVEPFRIPLQTAAGRVDVLLLARLPELRAARRSEAARSFRLLLPVAVQPLSGEPAP
jgi:hypothetical protein